MQNCIDEQYVRTQLVGLTRYGLIIPKMGIIIPFMGMINVTPHNLFFSKVQQLILKLLYLNDNYDFSTNEIIRAVNCGTGTVQRELEKFTTAGVTIMKCVGNQKRYQANQALSYYLELRSIIIKTFGLADHLKVELKQILTDKIKIAYIYGSFSKQTDTASSDIDLMLIGENLTYADLYQMLAETEKVLGRKINPSFYSPSEWRRKYKEGNNFITKIIEQPKIFLIGSEDELKELR